VLGIQALHDVGIMHRDIKPANILVDKDGNLKLTDYGLSELKKDLGAEGKFSKKGSLNFMAPEIFKPETKELTYGVDWYALGILVFDIIKERLPFSGETPQEVISQILNPSIKWDYEEELEDETYCFTPELKDLIKQLLEPNPEKRIGANSGAEEIKNHPYFKKSNPKNWTWVEEKKYYVYKPELVCNIKEYQNSDQKFKNMRDFIDEEFKDLLYSNEGLEKDKKRKINQIASKVEMLKHETLHLKNKSISKQIK
jgi:serine/threonine protein kinase